MPYRFVTPTPQQAASAVNAITAVWRMAPALATAVERLMLVYADDSPAVAVTAGHIVINPTEFESLSPERQVITLASVIGRGDHAT